MESMPNLAKMKSEENDDTYGLANLGAENEEGV